MAAPPLSLTRTEITPLFISQWTLVHDNMPEGIADAFSPHCSGRWRDQKPDTEEQGMYFLLQRISHIRAAVLSFQILQISRGSPAWRDRLECNSSQFTGVSNDRGISQTGACCTLKTQAISSSINPPFPLEVSPEHEIPLITFKIHELGVLII